MRRNGPRTSCAHLASDYMIESHHVLSFTISPCSARTTLCTSNSLSLCNSFCMASSVASSTTVSPSLNSLGTSSRSTPQYRLSKRPSSTSTQIDACHGCVASAASDGVGPAYLAREDISKQTRTNRKRQGRRLGTRQVEWDRTPKAKPSVAPGVVSLQGQPESAAQVQKNQGPEEENQDCRPTGRAKDRSTRGKRQERKRARRPPNAVYRSRSSGAGRSATSQQERVCVALRVQISNVTLECSLWTTTSAENKVAFAREGFTERAKNDQRVLVGVVHGHSTRSGCRVRTGEVGKEGEGHSGSIWLRAWATCSLCPLLGCARGQIERSSAVYALPRVEVRTSAGLKSAPGMRPGTSISAAWSQDCAAA